MKWLLLLMACLPAAAAAQCSRPIEVPVAPIGLSVFGQGSDVQGVYPDWLNGMQARIGCRFVFSWVPRARLNQMFEQGQADMLVPASRTAPRDKIAQFVPLIRTRPALLSLKDRELIPLYSLGDLLARRELRVAVVRGFDFGDNYRQAVDILQRQGRLVSEVDPAGVAKALQLGLADLSIMAPSILIGALALDEKLSATARQLRLDIVEEFPWNDSGVYLSRTRLSAADRSLLAKHLAGNRREVWRLFNHHYPPGSLGESIQAAP